jgi:hypothetical protein
MPRSRKRVRWSNGHVDSAATWQELLDKLRAAQWHPWDEDEFRVVLSKRCARWSGTEIDAWGTPRQLFRELERARLVEILRDKEKEEDF